MDSDLYDNSSLVSSSNESSQGSQVQPSLDLGETHKMLLELFRDPLLSDLRKLAGVDRKNSEEGVGSTNNGASVNTVKPLELLERVSVEQVDTLIALEQGTAFEIRVERGGLDPLVLVVKQNATIKDLKNMIKMRIERDEEEKKEKIEEKALKNNNASLVKRVNNNNGSGIIGNTKRQRKRRNKKICWKYIWKSYCLMFEGHRLLDDNARLQELNIRSGNVLRFSRLAGR
ncbi:8707_t:CDS:2 [Ambispora leptoticha]|uniref:8707_t:CDS:1 n=1 Tax=Ambispora leptoticha TaxID=144679 RepID=A0A9N8V6P1_9GLOM|nr:8707_t:CDS:2 [Ambispora leptoticha]